MHLKQPQSALSTQVKRNVWRFKHQLFPIMILKCWLILFRWLCGCREPCNLLADGTFITLSDFFSNSLVFNKPVWVYFSFNSKEGCEKKTELSVLLGLLPPREPKWLTGINVVNTRGQILISVQVDGNKCCVLAQYIASFAGVNSV